MQFKNTNMTASIADWGLWVDGIYDADKKATVFDGTLTYTQHYKYSGSGKALINGGSNTDYYIATLNKKSNLTINDKSGYDALLLTANHKNLRAFFNVDSSGNIVVDGNNTNSDNFILFNKANLTAANLNNVLNGNGVGAINIDHYFAENTGEGTYTRGSGALEAIYVSADFVKNYSNFTNGGYNKVYSMYTSGWINQISESVASWLSNKGYESSMAVLESGNSNDIASMLKVYAGIKCEVGLMVS